jgi:hypothetical protein
MAENPGITLVSEKALMIRTWRENVRRAFNGLFATSNSCVLLIDYCGIRHKYCGWVSLDRGVKDSQKHFFAHHQFNFKVLKCKLELLLKAVFIAFLLFYGVVLFYNDLVDTPCQAGPTHNTYA